MHEDDIPRYIAEIAALKEKYRNHIEILLGIEYDVYSPVKRGDLGLDFTIGSVHYLKTHDGNYISVDYTPKIFEDLVRKFGGVREVSLEYYRLLCEVIESRPDILGHFDLLTKFNSGKRFFDPDEAWYRKIVDDVIDIVAQSGIIVEVNTGAMSRGHRKTPYPSEYILRELYLNGVPVTISADAHSPNTIDFAFRETEAFLRRVGYKSVKMYRNGGFADMPI